MLHFYYVKSISGGYTPILNTHHPNEKGAEKQKPKAYFGHREIDPETHTGWTLEDYMRAYPLDI